MNATDLIGNTPMVDLGTLVGKPSVGLLAKVEGNNPGGSVKDRAALWMVKEAEARGDLTPGMRLVEATSGNTGIALAMIAAMKGYAIDLVMPDNATAERVLAMRAYGANVILTPRSRQMEGAIDVARERALDANTLMLDQFKNPDNYRAHESTTAPEIWRETRGAISHFVSAMGTTGTIMGCSRFFKSKRAAIQIVGVQPEDGAQIPGIRRWPSAYLPKIFDSSRVDRVIDIGRDAATAMSRRLAKTLGLSCGMSSGGAVAAALRLCDELDEGLVITVLCDRGDRYLSSDLFADDEPER